MASSRKKKLATDSRLADLAPSLVRYLRSEKFSPYTIANYTRTLRFFSAYLADAGLPDTVGEVDGDDITDWLNAYAERTSPNNALHHYRNLVALWAWLIEEEKLVRPSESPLLDVRAPKADPIPRPPLTNEQLAALAKVCSGTDFHDRRDAAIIRVFADTGMRLGGLVGLRYDPAPDQQTSEATRNDVFLDHSPPLLRLRLKGGDEHLVDIGRKTALAIDRYLRVRAGHPAAGSTHLWLASPGEQLGRGGVRELLNRRAVQAGIKERIHPHRFRRSAATSWLDARGSEEGLMNRMGWKSISMVRVYTSETTQRRAWEESQHLRLSDGF